MDFVILEKSRPHKYIQRLGMPGQYQYIYNVMNISEKTSSIPVNFSDKLKSHPHVVEVSKKIIENVKNYIPEQFRDDLDIRKVNVTVRPTSRVGGTYRNGVVTVIYGQDEIDKEEWDKLGSDFFEEFKTIDLLHELSHHLYTGGLAYTSESPFLHDYEKAATSGGGFASGQGYQTYKKYGKYEHFGLGIRLSEDVPHALSNAWYNPEEFKKNKPDLYAVLEKYGMLKGINQLEVQASKSGIIGHSPRSNFQKKYGRLVEFEERQIWQFPDKYGTPAMGSYIEIPKEVRIGKGVEPTPENLFKLKEAYLKAKSDLGYVNIQDLVDLTGIDKTTVHENLIWLIKSERGALTVNRWGQAIYFKFKENQSITIPKSTIEAIEIGKTLTREEAQRYWDMYKKTAADLSTFLSPEPDQEELQVYGDRATSNQFIREMVEAHLGFTGLESLTPEEIDERITKSFVVLEKARPHKYIRRLGTPSHYQYVYTDPENIGGTYQDLPGKPPSSTSDTTGEKMIYPEFWNRLPASMRETINDYYKHSAGVFEGYTIGQHTEMVLKQFDKYFSGAEHPSIPLLGASFFRFVLALHDLGKVDAMKITNDKSAQYSYNQRWIEKASKPVVGFRSDPDQALAVAKALVGQDLIGSYLKDNTPAELVVDQFLKLSEKIGVDPDKFYDLALVYFMCDAGAYTKDAGGKESLDYLFSFHLFPPGSQYGAGIINFAPDTARKMEKLETMLEDAGKFHEGYAILYHGTTRKYLKDIIDKGLQNQKWHNWDDSYYRSDRSKKVFATTDLYHAIVFGQHATDKVFNEVGLSLKAPIDNTAVVLKIKVPEDYFKKNAIIDDKCTSDAYELPEIKPEWIESVGVHKGDRPTDPTGISPAWKRYESVFNSQFDKIWERIKKSLEENFVTLYVPMTFRNWRRMQDEEERQK